MIIDRDIPVVASGYTPPSEPPMLANSRVGKDWRWVILVRIACRQLNSRDPKCRCSVDLGLRAMLSISEDVTGNPPSRIGCLTCQDGNRQPGTGSWDEWLETWAKLQSTRGWWRLRGFVLGGREEGSLIIRPRRALDVRTRI